MRLHRGTPPPATRGSIKPFAAMAALGVTAHNAFERRAGIGIVGEPWLGRRGSNALWSTVPVLLLAQAFGRRRRDEPLIAFGAGAAVAGSLVHFLDWPWTRRFGVLPWLTEAEGLEPDQLDAYNTILWLWMAGGLTAIARETRPRHLVWAAGGVATAPVLRALARHHFAWAREQVVQGDPNFTPALLAGTARRRV